ncbi:anthocyanidin 3-O-galactosyltransferase F3GT1-like [Cornus florida]|uniref:anthocyanidin 3-O-galactosyltransferase F3GT1-like n=1 Tax=Cornus florida TaxID=4283 RepID=UPI0028A27653|nr:anthocyanidin 3-O-galactosyltransferase F3GT1-like [Cornus florida]
MSTINSSPKNQHVAVLAFPFSTHAGPLLGLVRRLADAAPDVTFSFFSTTKSNQPLFSVPTPDNIIAYDVSDGVPEGYVFSGKPQEEIELFLKVAPENFRRGVEAAEADTERRISSLLVDCFLWFAAEMAVEMRVPWLPLWTSGACSLSVHFYTDLIRQTVGTTDVAGRENEILSFIPGFSAVRLGDLPSGVLFGNLESPFSIMLHKMGQALSRATAITINSFEDLDPTLIKDLKSKFPKFLNVGPFNLTSPPPRSNTDEHGCLAWLDKQKAKSVAYIGFGTVATPSPKEIVALAEALEASGTPFIWSLRDNMTSHLPKGFLKRNSETGKVVPWAPQVQVLAHASTGVLITHCGWNSVLESIAAGVPMIGRPFFGDQPLNIWMVENEWQIGLRVEGGIFTKSGTMRALEVIFSNEEGKKLKERIGVYRDLALKAVGPNGSSTENFKTLLKVVTGHKC